MNKTYKYSFFTVLILFSIWACKKNNYAIDKVITPPSVAEFPVTQATALNATYYIKNDPNSVFKIPIGINTVSNKDRTIQLTYTSSTGATQGTQYNAPATIVIPAGKTLDSLPIKGLFSGYGTGRKDSLFITISGGDVPANAYNNKFTLILTKYCDVIAANLIGDYANSIDYYGGAPSASSYTATITNWTPLSATSANVNIINLGATPDNGWGPFAPTDPVSNPGVLAKLDWTNPANFSVTILKQNMFNYGNGNSTVTATGSFSSCDQTFTIKFTVVYAGNGQSYTTTSVLKR